MTPSLHHRPGRRAHLMRRWRMLTSLLGFILGGGCLIWVMVYEVQSNPGPPDVLMVLIMLLPGGLWACSAARLWRRPSAAIDGLFWMIILVVLIGGCLMYELTSYARCSAVAHQRGRCGYRGRSHPLPPGAGDPLN
jgi:hypothetical protein